MKPTLPIDNHGIDRALFGCERAFATTPNPKFVWCCHHERLFELLAEDGFGARISYILEHKPREEHLIRFNNFRPVLNEDVFIKLAVENGVATVNLATEYRLKHDNNYIDYFNSKGDYMGMTPGGRAILFTQKDDSLEAEFINKKLQLETRLVAMYKQQVPNGTWNGESIFPKT